MTALAAALLVVAAVCAWPARGDGGAPEALAADGPGRVPAGASHVRRWLGRGGHSDDVVHLVEAVGAALTAGLGPADALVLVANSRAARAGPRTPVDDGLPALVQRARSGEHLSAGWRELAHQVGSPHLLLLARAWALSEASGAPLSAAATTAARLMRTDRDRQARAAAAVAGARATMRILTVLPLGGPALAALLGLDLVTLYGQSPAVWAALAGGLVLVALGRLWVGRLVAGAMHGPVLS